MSPDSGKGKKGKIIVVGAGVSGLSSAYRLQQAGFSVKVLESENRAGGKTRTLIKNGFMLEQGASIIPSGYSSILGIIDETGMSDQLCVGGSIVGFAKGNDIHYLDSAHLYRDSATTRLISFKSKILMLKVLMKNMRINKYLSYEDLSSASAFDVETASEYCDRELNNEIKKYIVDATLRGMLGTSADRNSVVDFFFSYSKILGAELYSLKNGIESYAKKLVETLDDVQLGARVSHVENTQNGARVTWTDGKGVEFLEDADSCVIALNAHLTSSLFPQLDEWSHQFLNGLKYTTAISVNVALSRPPKNNPAFVVQIPKSVHPDLFGITLEHNKAPHSVPSGKGALGLYAMSDWSEKLINENDDIISGRMIAAAETIIPGFSADIEFLAINRWYPVIVYSKPGDYKNLGRFIQNSRKYKGVKLAGDYFSSSNLNTAVTAGERAAREIIVQFG